MSKWSIKNAAIWGAGFGIAYIAATTFYAGESQQLAAWGGSLLGGGIGGAILFVIVASIRNASARV